jgi:hypothetical protein
MVTPFGINPELNPGHKAARFMTNRKENPPSRRLACAGCGTEFTCSLSGPCWCAEEDYRLPMPSDGSDCLCPDCLRKAAAHAASAAAT